MPHCITFQAIGQITDVYPALPVLLLRCASRMQSKDSLSPNGQTLDWLGPQPLASTLWQGRTAGALPVAKILTYLTEFLYPDPTHAPYNGAGVV
jgi:hypothetical protein